VLGAREWQTDVCPIAPESDLPLDARKLLDAIDFDTRMRRARAVILAEWCLRAPARAASPTFEIATRARQGGVPAYAVTGQNKLDPFEARMLDLQVILEASSTRALTAAGRRLGELV
jgi:glycerate kinase